MVQLSTKIITGHIWRSVGSNLHISAKNLRTSKWSKSIKNGSKHLMLSLSMAYNVIRNHQKYPPKIFALNRNLLNCTWWILLSICRKNRFFSKTHYSRFEFFPIAHGKKWLMWASSIAKIVEDKFFFCYTCKIALHLLFGWSLDKDKKSLDQSKQNLCISRIQTMESVQTSGFGECVFISTYKM